MNASRLRITFAIIVMSFMVIAGAWLALGPFKNVAPAQAGPSVIYVDQDAEYSRPNGLSWATAYTNVQRALTIAIPDTEIWVAEGVYYPGARGDTSATFQLKSGVALYGGFAATETLRTQRDWVVHVTVLSGDIDRNDLTDANGIVTDTVNITGTNAYHVVTGNGVTQTATLDGFTITAGQASGSSPDRHGGGMYNSDSRPQVTHVTFSGNWANDAGGGMYNGSNSSPMLTDVRLSGNHANWQGGGMYNTSGSNPALTNVTFSGNQAQYYGGGISNYCSSPALTNVTFSGNRADNGGGMYSSGSSPILMNVTFSGNQAFPGYGGGMSNWYSSNPMLTNVTFSGNVAEYGGGMYNYSSSPTLTHVTFSGNASSCYMCAMSNYSSDSGRGGGMYNSGSSPTLMNVTFSENEVMYGNGGGMYNTSGSNPALTNVTFSGNTVVAADGGGMSNDSSSPTLKNVIFSGNWAEFNGGGMSNSGSSSPMLMNVTFSGNWASDGGGMSDSDSSSPTLMNVTFSGNRAYFGCGGGMYNTSGSNPTLTNVTFSGNLSLYDTGGMSNYSASPGGSSRYISSVTLRNVTFSGNEAPNPGGGMCNWGSSPTLVNSLLWGNSPDEIYSDGSVPAITYSDVYTPTGVYSGMGNINADPQFVAPITATYAPTTTGNYRLLVGSQAIDAGNTLSVTVPTDLDGNPRVSGVAVDMGAYEYQAIRIYLSIVIKN